MKKLLTIAALAAVAAVAVPGSGAAVGTGKILKPFCTTGAFRCMSALRVDLPVVPAATASHDGLRPGRPAQGVQPRVGGRDQRHRARPSRSWMRTTTRRSSRI